MLIKKWVEYLHQYKQKEVEAVFKGFIDSAYDRCLEIGAGDGFVATMLKDYFKSFVATECNKDVLQKTRDDIYYCICNAERLPFRDKSFDFVFSSSVIEHIKDKGSCLAQIRKVLRKGGIIVHVVPSRFWKLLNYVLYYPYLIILLFNRYELKRHIEEKGRDLNNSKFYFFKFLFPHIHGQYKNHISEFISYGEKEWQALFKKNGFKIVNVINVPLVTSGYGFSFKRVKIFLERRGFSASYAFIMVPSLD